MSAMDQVEQGEPEPQPPAPPRARRRWLPRNVKITLMVLFLFFVGEYILLPELASARREFHQLSHLNFLWLILGALLEVAALVAYAELTHTVLSPGAPDRFRIFRINMWALAVSHVLPGGTVPGTAASYRLLTDSGVSGSTAAFGLATQGIGSAVVLNLIFWLSLLISIPLQGYNPLYGFAAILGVLLIAIFGAVVFLLTRGEKQAGVFMQQGGQPAPLREGRDRDLAGPEGGGPHEDPASRARSCSPGPASGRRPTGCSTPPRCGSSSSPSGPTSRPSTCWWPTGSPTSSPSSR